MPDPTTAEDYQLTDDDLARMTPEQIEKARKEGRLDALLGVPEETMAQHALARESAARLEAGEAVTSEHIDALAATGRHDVIADAVRSGRLADLLNDNTEEN